MVSGREQKSLPLFSATMSSKPQRVNKKPAATTKSKVTSKESRKKSPVAKINEPVAGSSDEESAEDIESGSESDDVDEEGMNRLIELLGDDGLDDFAQYQLGLVSQAGDGDEDEGTDIEDQEDGEEQVEDDDASEEEGEEPGAAILEALEDVNLEDVSSIDDDTVPRQKLIINNAVCICPN